MNGKFFWKNKVSAARYLFITGRPDQVHNSCHICSHDQVSQYKYFDNYLKSK